MYVIVPVYALRKVNSCNAAMHTSVDWIFIFCIMWQQRLFSVYLPHLIRQ